jgi:hypothetical protein
VQVEKEVTGSENPLTSEPSGVEVSVPHELFGLVS